MVENGEVVNRDFENIAVGIIATDVEIRFRRIARKAGGVCGNMVEDRLRCGVVSDVMAEPFRTVHWMERA